MLGGQQQLRRPHLLALAHAARHQAQVEGSLPCVQGLGRGALQGSRNRPEPEEASSSPTAMQRVGVRRGLQHWLWGGCAPLGSLLASPWLCWG